MSDYYRCEDGIPFPFAELPAPGQPLDDLDLYNVLGPLLKVISSMAKCAYESSGAGCSRPDEESPVVAVLTPRQSCNSDAVWLDINCQSHSIRVKFSLTEWQKISSFLSGYLLDAAVNLTVREASARTHTYITNG